MNPILIAAIAIVNLALICYSIGIITEQRRHRISRFVLSFLTVGVVFDIVATACMIIGSTTSPFSPHGILGYSSLVGMLVDAILVWRFWLANGNAEVPRGLHLYTRIAYSWWILAYLTGAVLVAMR